MPGKYFCWTSLCPTKTCWNTGWLWAAFQSYLSFTANRSHGNCQLKRSATKTITKTQACNYGRGLPHGIRQVSLIPEGSGVAQMTSRTQCPMQMAVWVLLQTGQDRTRSLTEQPWRDLRCFSLFATNLAVQRDFPFLCPSQQEGSWLTPDQILLLKSFPTSFTWQAPPQQTSYQMWLIAVICTLGSH